MIFNSLQKQQLEIDLRTGGWEYAPMFNMKFHCDERSLDMTRRRRWHRKMVPDQFSLDQNQLDSSSSSTEGIIANTDIVFRMQSKIDQHHMDLTPTKMKEIRIELSSPRIFLTFKSKFSFISIECVNPHWK